MLGNSLDSTPQITTNTILYKLYTDKILTEYTVVVRERNAENKWVTNLCLEET